MSEVMQSGHDKSKIQMHSDSDASVHYPHVVLPLGDLYNLI